MRLEWPGFNEKGSVIIDIALEEFCYTANTVVFENFIFSAKEEVHVTLISSELGSILLHKIKLHPAIRRRLRDIFEEIDWSFKKTGPVHVLSRKKEDVVQKSIIMQIEMPGVAEFYDQLKVNGMIDAETPVPPPHVTLFTFNCPVGIGVPSVDALNELTVSIFSIDEFSMLFND
jgi:hypothetical protein